MLRRKVVGLGSRCDRGRGPIGLADGRQSPGDHVTRGSVPPSAVVNEEYAVSGGCRTLHVHFRRAPRPTSGRQRHTTCGDQNGNVWAVGQSSVLDVHSPHQSSCDTRGQYVGKGVGMAGVEKAVGVVSGVDRAGTAT
jgi:hypothetical protein